nr:cinnamoyl-CoA reductase 1-like [Coffea arabica]
MWDKKNAKKSTTLRWVDVGDVAYALIIAFEIPSASGRYCLVERSAHAPQAVGDVSNNRELKEDVVVDESWFSDPSYCEEQKISVVSTCYWTKSEELSPSMGKIKIGYSQLRGTFIGKKDSWYALSKTLAEDAAWKFTKEHGIEIITIYPGFVVGPILQPSINLNIELILNLVNGARAFPNATLRWVDVRDVGEIGMLTKSKQCSNLDLVTTLVSISAGFSVV